MTHSSKQFGARGEDAARLFLQKHGYSVLEHNYYTKIGEVDLIYMDGEDTLIFAEVKTRKNSHYGPPQLAVTAKKQRQIAKAAISYIKKHCLRDVNVRFDVISILYNEHNQPEISHIKNAFQVDGFMI